MHTQQEHPLVRASLAVSLDGYIADKDGDVGWLNPFFSDEIDFMGFMNAIGVAVMGRRTFDIAASGALGPMPPTSYPTFVPTHRPMPKPPKGYEPFGGTPSELVDRLRVQLAKSGKDIWLMGAARQLTLSLPLGSSTASNCGSFRFCSATACRSSRATRAASSRGNSRSTTPSRTALSNCGMSVHPRRSCPACRGCVPAVLLFEGMRRKSGRVEGPCRRRYIRHSRGSAVDCKSTMQAR
jgi:dihydrofolate reductase